MDKFALLQFSTDNFIARSLSHGPNFLWYHQIESNRVAGLMISASVARRHRQLWRRAYFMLIPCAILALGGALVTNFASSVQLGTISHRIVMLFGVAVFVGFAMGCLHIVASTMRKVVSHYLGPGRAANAEFFTIVAGYVVILLATLALLHIPVENLLLGGAVTGIILGVAAQQALANFFASVILLLTQPY